jgi:xylulokinase
MSAPKAFSRNPSEPTTSRSAMNWLLGLDIGTTTIKAAAYDPQVGRVVCTAVRPTPVVHPAPDLAEHDPESLWQAAADCLCEVVAQGEGQMLRGLAIASLAEAGLPLDATMQPLHPIIAWWDQRSEPQAAWWDSQIGADALYAITGQRVSPSFGVTKWLWIREHWPDVAARTVKWLSVPDYLLWRLTGAEVTDYSIASRTLLFDQQKLAWSEELLRLAGLRADQLPQPRPSGASVGAVTRSAAKATGLPAGLPCVLGGHDHLCASLAAGAHRPGVAVDSSGTAQAVVVVMPAFHTSPAAAAGGFACYAHVVPGQYAFKAGMKLAGGAAEWLARRLSGPEVLRGELPYEALAAEAGRGLGLRAGPLWLPHLIGSGTPEGDRHSLAALVGVRAEHDSGDLYRGLLESLALWLRHNVEEMAALTGQAVSDVVLLGGTTRLGLLSQLKADCLGLAVVVPELPEAAATGAALLAGLGAGVFPSLDLATASLRHGRTTIKPDAGRVEWYDRLYRQVYRRLYTDLREINHALAGFT